MKILQHSKNYTPSLTMEENFLTHGGEREDESEVNLEGKKNTVDNFSSRAGKPWEQMSATTHDEKAAEAKSSSPGPRQCET
ncbi:hypothetical protein J6590_040087 [Homalodisca vitripennis]|nr:hypothetical protein J6590_040087 [Homalodisca vitripennis]